MVLTNKKEKNEKDFTFFRIHCIGDGCDVTVNPPDGTF
jgi:hypothetical protein